MKPKKNDRRDDRCAFEGTGEGPCQPVVQGSWCYGCKFYVCELHSRNLNMPFGGHDVVAHLDDLEPFEED